MLTLCVAAAPSNQHPSLPPSVEEAYRRKTIDLRRRTQEIEDLNDQTRLRIIRLKRGIDKQRLERAILLDHLAKLQQKNGDDPTFPLDENSENSSDEAPTVSPN